MPNLRSLIGFGAAAIALALSGCGPKTDTSSATAAPGAADPGAVLAETGPLKGDVEVAAFKGGYGIDFYEAAATEFGKSHPDVVLKVWGDPRVWEQLRPRFVKGDVPDLMFPGWGMDHWALKEEGQLLPLDAALKTKAVGSDQTWGDTFEPALLKLGQMDGKQWVLPFYFSMFGWWYDPGVFAKNGWTPPKTYEELLTLGEKIKAKGMAPITFQGMYPYYMIEGMLLPWAMSDGGKSAVDAAQNMEPGAWKSPSFLKAAGMIAELNEKGFFQKGAVSMSHTESQQQFLQGKAAMIPCGTWLFSEMREQIPAGAKMEFFRPPMLAGGKGDPSAVQIGIEPWMIPAKARNPRAGIELFKSMTSLENAKRFVKEKGTLTAIKGSDAGELPEVLKAPAQAFRESTAVWSNQYRQFYPDFQKELENALTAMLNKELTPQAFVDRVEAAAEKVRKDDRIPKHKIAS